MSRLGWVILAVIVIVGAAFASVTRFGSAEPGRRAAPVPVPSHAAVAMPGALVVPVQGVASRALHDTWGDAREGGARQHHGTDIPAAQGTPVLAAADGRVEKLFQSVRGGTTVYIRTRDPEWMHYYAHLAGYAPGLHEGQAVRAGEAIGYVGDTGDAGAGNFHLHFGVQHMAPGMRWWQGEEVNPYPMLAARPGGR